MNIFQIFLTQPILNILIAFYKVLLLLHVPGALGIAILLLSIAVRLLVWPLTSTQLKSTKKMTELKPHLDRIRKEHGHDKVRHNQEINKLYKEHGVNPLAGCLPLLLQLPVFFALYRTLLQIIQLKDGSALSSINQQLYFPFLHLDKVPSASFLGFSLVQKPNQWHEVGVLILIIPIATALFQFVQSKMLVADEPKNKIVKSPKKSEGKESMEDTMAQMSSQMAYIMPAMFALISFNFPIGVALYWNTFTIIGIIQQYLIIGPGSLNKYLPEKWQK